MIFSLITQSITVSEAQSLNVIGIWNVEITFANDEHRSVRFDAELMEKAVWSQRTRDPEFGTGPSLPTHSGIEVKKTR